MDERTETSTEEGLRALLSRRLFEDRERYFGAVRADWVQRAQEYFWDESQQDFRVADMLRHGFSSGTRVLDLAAGCGQFMFYASRAGYQVFGVEPERWKLDFMLAKQRLSGNKVQIADRLVGGIGESLPFKDSSFDCVSSFQTLEHVQDPLRVIQEAIRVTRVGGGIFIRCPDYRSTFEAHYQLPWLPMFSRNFAKWYVRTLGRPSAGVDTIRYVTKKNIESSLTQLEHSGMRFAVFDDTRIDVENGLRRKGLPGFAALIDLWTMREWCRNLFRQELSVNLFVRVLAK